MTFKNKTERETYLNCVVRDRISSVLYLAVLINLYQQGSPKDSYFSERFKV